MLTWAKEAGIHLLKVKEKVRHGEFKAWIAANCECSYSQAARYMKVAKNLGDKTFEQDLDASIEAFLGYDKPKIPCPTVTTIDRGRIAAFWDDAAHALKLHTSHHFPTTTIRKDTA